MRQLFLSKKGITDKQLNIVMFVVVVLAIIAATVCVFVVGRALETQEAPDTSEPLISQDTPGHISEQSPPVSDISTPQESDVSEPPSTVTEPIESESESATVVVPPESETQPSLPPQSFVPVTPSNVSTINHAYIYSDHAMLVDCSTGNSIAQRLADYRIYPASMTKIMTVVVAFDQIKDLQTKFTMTQEIINECYNQHASVAGFVKGESVTALDLIYGAILPSGADATYALCVLATGKSDIFEAEAEFAKLMNRKALELGMESTNFVTASGLHHKDHRSTVRDIATLMNYAVHRADVKTVLSAVSYKTTTGRTLVSAVFSKTDYTHRTYSNGLKMVAAKSGYTDYAMFCLASYYEDSNGKGYVLVTAMAYQNSYQPIADAKYIVEAYIN